VNEDESVGRGDAVERCSLLVTEEHVRDPDLVPAVTELQLTTIVVLIDVEHETTVVPLLTQVHAQREVLRTAHSRALSPHLTRGTLS